MMDLQDIEILSDDFFCPTCKAKLMATPGGYWVCFAGHTKLLNEQRCREIVECNLRSHALPLMRKWLDQQMREGSKEYGECDGLDNTNVLIPTSIRGVYLIAGFRELFKTTRSKRVAEFDATKVSPKRKSKKLVLARGVTPRELRRYINRGSFKVNEA